MSNEANPYAAPQSDLTVETRQPRATPSETIRAAYLAHETSVRSIGFLYYFLSALCAIGVIVCFVIVPPAEGPLDDPWHWLGGTTWLLLMLSFIAVGMGLRHLNPRVRLPVTILSVLGMVGIPFFGTILGPIVVWLIHSGKGKTVFSSEYRQVICDTPHLRNRGSLILVILISLSLVLALMLALGLATLMYV